MLGSLGHLLGRAEAQVNPFDHGATFSNPHPQQNQGQLPPDVGIGGAMGAAMGARQMQPMQHIQPMQLQPAVPIGQDPANLGYPPDITYDPTGRTPYSARTPELAQQGNQYVANPTDPRWLGVDPAQFGFPADNTARQPAQHQDIGGFLKDLLSRLR